MRIPFGKRNTYHFIFQMVEINVSDFMEEAKNTLDKCVYGLE